MCGRALPDREPSALPSGPLGASVCGARPSAPRPCRRSHVLPAAMGTACVFWRLHMAGAGSVGAVLGRPKLPPAHATSHARRWTLPKGAPSPSGQPGRPGQPRGKRCLSWALVWKALSKYRRAGLAGELQSRPPGRPRWRGRGASLGGSGGRGVAQSEPSWTELVWGGDMGLSGPRAGGHSGVSGDAGSASQSTWLWWRSVCSRVQGALTVLVQPPCGVWCGTHLSELRPPVFSCFFFFFSV